MANSHADRYWRCAGRGREEVDAKLAPVCGHCRIQSFRFGACEEIQRSGKIAPPTEISANSTRGRQMFPTLVQTEIADANAPLSIPKDTLFHTDVEIDWESYILELPG